MTALMNRAARALWAIAGLVLVAGLGSWVYRHASLGAGSALTLGGLYLQNALTPLLLGSVGLALVLGVASRTVAALPRRGDDAEGSVPGGRRLSPAGWSEDT